MKNLVSLLILLFCSLSLVYSLDIYVDASWPYNGTGTSNCPFDSISYAISLAVTFPNESSVIHISPGMYYQNLVISGFTSDLTLMNSNPSQPVTINGYRHQSVVTIEGCSGKIELNGLTVKSTIFGSNPDHCQNGGGINASTSNHVIINGCIIQGNKAHYGGGIFAGSKKMEISNSTIIGNAVIGSQPGEMVIVSGGGAIYCANENTNEGAHTVDIIGCRISSNSSSDYGGAISNFRDQSPNSMNPIYLTIQKTQIFCNTCNKGGAVFFRYKSEQDNSSIKMINCTVMSNGNSKSVLISSNNNSVHHNMQFINSIIRHNSGIDQGGVTPLVYDVSSAMNGSSPVAIDSVLYCNVGLLQGYSSSFSQTTNINADPLFTNETAHYYSLKWDAGNKSPCIDTGNPDAEYNNNDGTPSDIGALPCTIAHQYKATNIPAIGACKGWKWMSEPVLDTITNNNRNVSYVFGSILNTSIIDEILYKPYDPNDPSIKYIMYDPQNHWWTNQDHIVSSTEGYKIAISENHTEDTLLPSSGYKTPDNTTIPLIGGGEENWIGYFRSSSSSFSEAFELIWDDLVSIKTQDYCLIKVGNEWQGDMERACLNYGDMVIVRCHNDHASFIWNQSAKEKKPIEKLPIKEFVYEEKSDYIPVYIDLRQIEDEIPEEIGMMVNGVCKGAVAVDDSLMELNAYILEEPNMENAEVTFSLYYGNDKSATNPSNLYVYSQGNRVYEQQELKLSPDAEFYKVALGNKAPSMPTLPKMVLEQNYPNPFNPTTQIRFNLPKQTHAKLDIYNIKGQLVNCLVDEDLNGGYHSYVWNGIDKRGSKCSSGMYFYQLKTSAGTLTRKMILMK